MVKLTILGPPATKKTAQRIIYNRRTKRPMIIPSKRSKDWEANAIAQLSQATLYLQDRIEVIKGKKKPTRHFVLFAGPVQVTALIYRETNRGDLHGFFQAIADALERADVIANDKLIWSWDRSRPLIDRDNPRVELAIEPMPSNQQTRTSAPST